MAKENLCPIWKRQPGTSQLGSQENAGLMLLDLSGLQEKPAGPPPGHSLFLFPSVVTNSWVLTYLMCFIC